MIWLRGGPSHIDSYDMKPDAPAEIRGEFKPIATNVPGIQICEHLPLHAQIMDKLADRPRHQVERPRRPHAALHPHRLPRPRQAAGVRLGRQLPAAADRRPAALRQPDVQAAGPVRQRRPDLPRPGPPAVRAQGRGAGEPEPGQGRLARPAAATAGELLERVRHAQPRGRSQRRHGRASTPSRSGRWR